MSEYYNNSIFWIETEKIGPNPFQPRRDFDPKGLEDLADSIRQYGVLQPLVVTRKEEETQNGGLSVSYELIAGERRLRASKIAKLEQVPVIIRKETDNKVKLELSIIENLQREDLNPIDRALAFEQLHKQFELTHAEIGKKMGKSRVYVSNTLRLLSLPDDMKHSLTEGRITEGHTRPLLMLTDRPDEQATLFKEILLKKMSVRESEKIARSIAQDRVRKKEFIRDPRISDFEKRLSDNLGTRVQIEQLEKGGKITIDYFTLKDVEEILNSIQKIEHNSGKTMLDNYVNQEKIKESKNSLIESTPINFISGEKDFERETTPNETQEYDETKLSDEEKFDEAEDTTLSAEKTEVSVEDVPEVKETEIVQEIIEEEIETFPINNPDQQTQIQTEINDDDLKTENDFPEINNEQEPNEDKEINLENQNFDSQQPYDNQDNTDQQETTQKKIGFFKNLFK